MTDALISVIVPVYNVEKYLTKCLDSIVSQTYTDLEILLIDDGSTDGSGEICDRFASKDSRIKVIHKPNGGVSTARNLGMELCTGEYIMFVDSDDYLSENAVEHLLHRLIADGSDLAIGRYARICDDAVCNGGHKVLDHDAVLTQAQAIATLGTEWELPNAFWGRLHSRSALRGIVFPLLRYGEDVWIFQHILENCKAISIDSNLTYYYVERPGSAVHTTKDEMILESISAFLYVADYLKAHNLPDNALTYYKETINRAMRVKNRKKAREMILSKMDRETKKKLLHKDIRTDIRWISLYVPWLFPWLKGVQRVLFRKQNEE